MKGKKINRRRDVSLSLHPRSPGGYPSFGDCSQSSLARARHSPYRVLLFVAVLRFSCAGPSHWLQCVSQLRWVPIASQSWGKDAFPRPLPRFRAARLSEALGWYEEGLPFLSSVMRLGPNEVGKRIAANG